MNQVAEDNQKTKRVQGPTPFIKTKQVYIFKSARIICYNFHIEFAFDCDLVPIFPSP